MRKFSNITGIKNICLLLGITASALFAVPSASADVIADPDYPYNASEIVTVFHDGWINGYDKINEDLRVTETAAKEEWSDEAMVAQFHITCADGTENGYSFDFMKKDDTTKIFSADPVMDEENPWHYEETDNTANLISPLSNVDLTLRKLIPAMQNDVRLLRSIDEGIADDANTGMFITLKENADQVSTWYIEFQVSGKEQHKTYLVWVSAEDAARPMFKVVRKK